MKVLIAIDSFKGSLNSREAGEACADGIRAAMKEAGCVVLPMADGGEGTTDALTERGGRKIRIKATGPVGKPVSAEYGITADGMAVMEMASAAGLTLVSGEEKNPSYTTTYGVGEMIADAIGRGCRKFLIGIGGSATNDAGAGMLQALGYRICDSDGIDLPYGGAALIKTAKISAENALPELKECVFRIACDVTNPLCGENGASKVFGPQKGATPAMVEELDAALRHFADVSGFDSDLPGAGAAGGLGFAFAGFLGGELKSGAEIVLEETGFETQVTDADIVVTGEGRIDGQTAMGKAPIIAARMAKRHGKTVIAFCGCTGDGAESVNDAGIDAFFPVLRKVCPLEEALNRDNAAANLKSAAEQVFRILKATDFTKQKGE